MTGSEDYIEAEGFGLCILTLRVAEALKLAKNDPDAVKRIQYFGRHLVGQIKAGSDKYFATRSAISDWKYTVLQVSGTPTEAQWKSAPKVYMVPYKPDSFEVRTSFRILRDSKNLYFRVDCGLSPFPETGLKATKNPSAEARRV